MGETEAERQSGGAPAGGLVGRGRELAALLGAFDAAVDGNGSLILIAGEPGIGKTTLAESLATQAREHGAITVWGRAWDAGGSPPFWPWRQIVRKLASSQTDEDLIADAGPDGRWLVSIAPELDARLAGEDPVEPSESEQTRFAQFDALATYLRACASRAPLVVMLDDIHAADTASLRALDFLARSLADARVLLIATLQEAPLRKTPEILALVSALDRHGERIALGGLTVADITELLASRTGTDVTEEVARSVHRRTDGNPLFAEEVRRALAARGLAAEHELPLPDGMRGMMRDRIAALDETGQRVLAHAAVIGLEFRITTIERVVGLDRLALLDVLDEGEQLGLIVGAREPGLFRFRHGVIRETLYQDLRATQRAEAHLRVGEALREAYGDEPPSGAASELAHHFVEAARLGDAGPAVEYSRRAGAEAMAIFGFEQAAYHFETALRALDLGVQDDGERGRLMLELAIAQDASSHPAAEATLLAAADVARQLGDKVLLAEVALEFGPYALSPGVVDDAWVGLVQEAIDALGDAEPTLRARLLARLGRAIYFGAGAGKRREELAEEAVAIARSAGDRHALSEVLSDAHVAIWGPDRARDALRWIAEHEELLEELGDSRRGLPALSRSIDLQLELGDIAGADMALGRLEVKAAQLNDMRAATLVSLHRSRQAIVEGRFADVQGLLQEATRRGDELRYSPVGLMVGGQAFCVRLLCGGLEELEPAVRQYADELPAMPVWRAALARAYVERGQLPQARRELDRMAADGFAGVERDSQHVLTLGIFAEVAWRTGAIEHAAVLKSLITPFADRMLISSGGAFLGPVQRTLGQLAALDGDVPAAIEHFEVARSTALSHGAAPSVVLVDADEAAVRLAAGDVDGARALLDNAHAGAGALGMGAVAARVATLRLQAGESAPAPSPLAAAPEPKGVGALTLEGDTWSLSLDGRRLRLRDGKGVRYLAVLLGNPGVEVHAIDLVAEGGSGQGTAGMHDAGLTTHAGTGDAGPILDAEAKMAYKARIAELRETLDEAERFNDPERASAAREELDMIAAELAGAVGLGGRDRRAASSTERARVNVTRAIRSTLRRVAEHDPALGGELESTVRTGTHCSYEPSPLHPITWEVNDVRGR